MSNRFPGSGERIAERMRALGYWQQDSNRPDVMRFCRQVPGYIPQYVYEWLKGTMPSYENLLKLAGDLETTPQWILFGDGATGRRKLPVSATGGERGTRRARRSV